ncbi:polysaccharide pyruvyl transferase family protein [Paenibacillus shunpengii]|uniref:Polysaccharide pyruvyl transferase family protein n=1 Tax=Paenibacillus shunpengii TaxID=2054424 RepID=A0ABW5SQ23_9BACL|nr:polysaccharide pyruvyl transferase family protein [Paenibacillus sp. PDC88]SDX19772.1 Polysaccharide pyruvyl transferase family protein WcaK [Paenibacillus sp. PDC88]
MRQTIILRSSWQVVNIGDIAHTPGLLAILEKYMPQTQVVLWPSKDFTVEVEDMICRRFPQLKVVKGTIGEDGKASNEELQMALDESSFLLHGSGPLLVGRDEAEAYVKFYKKPFGVFGITYGGYNEGEWCREIHSLAKFIYFRDSVSLQKAIQDGVSSPVMKFGPDAAFAVDLENDAKAEVFLRENKLEPGKFLCCISRHRYTPYWEIKDWPYDADKDAFNQQMKEQDNAPLREAIIQVVRKTGLKVLLCPEDKSQMAFEKEMIYDLLPEDVLPNVVYKSEFWLTDEAVSVYRQSAGLFGSEMHSPIMCIGSGIPAIVCRWEGQTTKGFMWRDIGLGDWLFDQDQEAEMSRLVPAVLDMAIHNEAAKEKALAAKQKVEKLYVEMVDTLKNCLNA